MNLEPTLELVEGIVRGKNKVSLLSGGSKTGKSSIALDLAYSVSKGLPFLNKPTIQRDVLYISLDNSYDLIAERLKLMEFKENSHLDFFCDGPVYLTLDSEQSLDLENKSLSEVINDAFERLPNLGLVIIDLLEDIRKLDSTNEYSNTLAANDIKTLINIAETFDVHIILLNHDNKNKENNQYNSSKGPVQLTGTINGSYIHLIRNCFSNDLARLEVGGRNVREQVFLLKHIKEKTKFELYEENAIEPEQLDYDIAKIRNFVIKTGCFESTLGALCAELKLNISANSLSRKLKQNKQLLLEEHICFEKTQGRTNGRIYRFYIFSDEEYEKLEQK